MCIPACTGQGGVSQNALGRGMCTVRSSSHVYPSMHWAGGCTPKCTGQRDVYPRMHWPGGVYPSMHWAGECIPKCTGQGWCVSQIALGRGVSTQGMCVCPGGWCLAGGVSGQGGVYPSMHLGRYPPPPWTEWQTGVKTLPCRNYAADSNKLVGEG